MSNWNNLFKRWVDVDLVDFSLCHLGEETTQHLLQHLFVECNIANCIWNNYYKWLDIVSLQYNELMSHFEKFYLFNTTMKQNLLRKEQYYIVFGTIEIKLYSNNVKLMKKFFIWYNSKFDYSWNIRCILTSIIRIAHYLLLLGLFIEPYVVYE